MNDARSKGLLPDGLRDGLPPDAAHEADILDRLIATFTGRGYERVDPPLVEFEDSLLDGAGEDVALATFRLMDPVSQRMMGIRADMTIQVGRIAATRLANTPRPLRLAYAGPVLRVRGDQLRPERQFHEAGAELIGAEEASADAEVILLAAAALSAVGVERLSVDINLPTLTPAVFDTLGFDAETAERARLALDRKDAAGVAELGGDAAQLLGGLLAAAGPAGEALLALRELDLNGASGEIRDRLETVVAGIRDIDPDLVLTIDPVEHRGFEYHTGLSFTLFARGVRGSLGRGGRYAAGGNGEPATGFTLFLDSVLRAAPAPTSPRRVYLPHGSSEADGERLRAERWVTVAGLAPADNPEAEARRLGCNYLFRDGDAVELEKG